MINAKSASDPEDALLDFAPAIVQDCRHSLLVLDDKLTIRAANSVFYKVFNLDPDGTIGNSLLGLSGSQWNIPALIKMNETAGEP